MMQQHEVGATKVSTRGGSPDDRTLLQQVWPFVEDCQKQMREHILLQQWRGFEAQHKGEVVKEKLFAIFVDYPEVIERTTLLSERFIYEREYVRETRLIREYQLPPYREELGKKTVIFDGHGDSQEYALSVRQNGGFNPQHNAPVLPAGENSSAPASKLSGGIGDSAINKAGLPESAAQPHSKSIMGSKKDNPWEGFVQPKADVSVGPAKEAGLKGAPLEGKHAEGNTKSEKPRKKKKKRFSLKWLFSTSFKEGQDGRPPRPEDYSSGQNLDTMSDMMTTQDVLETHELDGGTPYTTQPLSPFIDSRPRDSSDGRAQVEEPQALIGDRAENATVGVPAAAAATAEEEVKKELFMQIEEKRITKERIEKIVNHRYFLREFIIKVAYTGERQLGHSVEMISSKRYVVGESA